jgi:hypothetical protein
LCSDAALTAAAAAAVTATASSAYLTIRTGLHYQTCLLLQLGMPAQATCSMQAVVLFSSRQLYTAGCMTAPGRWLTCCGCGWL